MGRDGEMGELAGTLGEIWVELGWDELGWVVLSWVQLGWSGWFVPILSSGLSQVKSSRTSSCWNAEQLVRTEDRHTGAVGRKT